MRTRAEAIQYLRKFGYHANERNWSLGESIVVACGAGNSGEGVITWQHMVCLAPDAEGWNCHDLQKQNGEFVTALSLREACDEAMRRLGNPADTDSSEK